MRALPRLGLPTPSQPGSLPRLCFGSPAPLGLGPSTPRLGLATALAAVEPPRRCATCGPRCRACSCPRKGARRCAACGPRHHDSSRPGKVSRHRADSGPRHRVSSRRASSRPSQGARRCDGCGPRHCVGSRPGKENHRLCPG
jgi:hypothetical protein